MAGGTEPVNFEGFCVVFVVAVEARCFPALFTLLWFGDVAEAECEVELYASVLLVLELRGALVEGFPEGAGVALVVALCACCVAGVTVPPDRN